MKLNSTSVIETFRGLNDIKIESMNSNVFLVKINSPLKRITFKFYLLLIISMKIVTTVAFVKMFALWVISKRGGFC